MIDEAVTSLRLQLRAGGFLCIPVEGKKPPNERVHINALGQATAVPYKK